MNVGAEDKATRRARGSPPTNYKGHLSDRQIEKMIMQAGLFADVDKKVMERGDAKKASDDYLQQFDPLLKVSLLITNMIATLEAQLVKMPPRRLAATIAE